VTRPSPQDPKPARPVVIPANHRHAPIAAPMRRLRLIDDLRLHNCSEDVDAMTPVPGGRHCDSCRKTVHDLSALTRRAAERLVADRTGPRRCYRYLARDDGTLVFAPEPTRPAAPLLALALAACTPWGPPPEPAMDDAPARDQPAAEAPRDPPTADVTPPPSPAKLEPPPQQPPPPVPEEQYRSYAGYPHR